MTTRYEFQNKIGIAMRKRFNKKELDKEYNEIIEKEKKLIYPEFDIDLKAMMYIIGCAWSDINMYESINMMYHSYEKVKEKELIDVVKKLINKIKLDII